MQVILAFALRRGPSIRSPRRRLVWPRPPVHLVVELSHFANVSVFLVDNSFHVRPCVMLLTPIDMRLLYCVLYDSPSRPPLALDYALFVNSLINEQHLAALCILYKLSLVSTNPITFRKF